MPTSFDVALQDFHAGRFADAEVACRAGLQALPNDLPLLSLHGVTLHRLGRIEDALVVCRRAIAQHPEAPEPLINLAAMFQAAGRTAEMERCLHRLRAVHPASLHASQRLGVSRQEHGDVDDALLHIRRSARLGPFASGTLFNLGTLLLSMGHPVEGATAFAALVGNEPDSGLGYAQLAACLLVAGDVKRASELYERAYRLDPSNADAIDGRVRCRRYRVALASATHKEVPQGLLVRGPYQGISGYAHMTNRLVDSLAIGGTRVHKLGLLGNEPWASPIDAAVRGRSILSCLTPPTVERVPGLMTVNLSMFEGTRIPPSWYRFSLQHDLVIVPTESSRVAWAERGYPEERLRVCPLGVDPEMMDGPLVQIETPSGRPVTSYKHRVLNVSDFIPRKNVDGVLRVWLKATSAMDDAVLVLKLGKGNTQTRAAIEALFQQTEALVGKKREEAAPIMVICAALDEDSMTRLFRTATHYWSLSHGEGWDLPMSKAGAMGLQLIAPAHSSYVDYLDDGVARMIPCTIGPAHLPNSHEPWPVFHGLDWWEPDEDVAAEFLHRVIHDQDGRPRDARTRLLERFAWSQAADRLLSILCDVGAA
ncbi:tetratricopeptide repeat protein [Azospirillum sp.]|uniref:tetratricopeptide repeat-containing glycosyltransferase family protein n=1 Tax=Azospirillum sp. TaxID=34012 RepID=UPI00260E61BD|nr:tetratricopeptide repeat protein [Azospirillum sp.]